MQGDRDPTSAQPELHMPCSDLAGHRHELIVIADRVGLLVVFPPAATAVLARPQVAQFRAALTANPGADRTVSR